MESSKISPSVKTDGAWAQSVVDSLLYEGIVFVYNARCDMVPSMPCPYCAWSRNNNRSQCVSCGRDTAIVRTPTPDEQYTTSEEARAERLRAIEASREVRAYPSRTDARVLSGIQANYRILSEFTPQELSRIINLNPTAITHSLARLAKAGHICQVGIKKIRSNRERPIYQVLVPKLSECDQGISQGASIHIEQRAGPVTAAS